MNEQGQPAARMDRRVPLANEEKRRRSACRVSQFIPVLGCVRVAVAARREARLLAAELLANVSGNVGQTAAHEREPSHPETDATTRSIPVLAPS